MRKFEVVSAYKDKEINIPVRKTKNSAGYDIESAEKTIIHAHKGKVVNTGLKAFMPEDEYLQISVRSGISISNNLSMINGVGIIDSDYYNNPDNEGNIGIPLFNHGNTDYMIEKGQRIAQGIFLKFGVTDDDDKVLKETRVGGKGSTGK